MLLLLQFEVDVEAVVFAARAALLASSVEAPNGNSPLSNEQRICCLYNLAAEMEHLGGLKTNHAYIGKSCACTSTPLCVRVSLGIDHVLTRTQHC